VSVGCCSVCVAVVAEGTREVTAVDDRVERVANVLVRGRRAGDRRVASIQKRQDVIRCIIQSPVNIDALSTAHLSTANASTAITVTTFA